MAEPSTFPHDPITKPRPQRIKTVYAIDETAKQPEYVPLSHIRHLSDVAPLTPDSPINSPSQSSIVPTFTTEATSVATPSPAHVNDDHEIFQCSFSLASNERFDDNADSWFPKFRTSSGLPSSLADECPDRDVLDSIGQIPIFSADGSSQPFSSLYDPDQGATHSRQLIIFVRHFYCGACQAYLSALAEGIPMRDYFAIPTPTNIIVIGCGKPDLIPHYKRFSQCPFPIFADPSRRLFKRLGMQVTTKIGKTTPEYMADITNAAWMKGQVTTIRDSLRDPEGIRKRDVFRGGNPLQIGGEFLFEDGKVVWCHRMRNYRDHTEIKEIRRLLELDED